MCCDEHEEHRITRPVKGCQSYRLCSQEDHNTHHALLWWTGTAGDEQERRVSLVCQRRPRSLQSLRITKGQSEALRVSERTDRAARRLQALMDHKDRNETTTHHMDDKWQQTVQL